MTEHVLVPSNIGMGFLGLVYRNVGGAFEFEPNRGISHLMEHLMCKTFDDLQEPLKSLGIDYNATTSSNQIVFWFSGLNSSLEEVSELLYNRITNPLYLWTEEAFLNERNTVLQEWADTFNDQTSVFYHNVLRDKYGYAGPIGIKQDIENFSYEKSIESAKFFRTPTLVCEVGERSNLGQISFDGVPYKATPRNIKFGSGLLFRESYTKENKTTVGVVGTSPINKKDASKVDLLITCLTGGLESPLYKEIREKRGLSYFSIGDSSLVGDSLVPIFLACTTNENVNSLVSVYNNFFSVDMDQHITKFRFEICKKQLLIKKKVSEILPHSGVRATIVSDVNPFENIESFSYDEAIEMARKIFNPSVLDLETD